MRYKDIHWIMTRYNHDNPHMWLSTSLIASKIGKNITWTRNALKEMKKQNIVKSTKNGSLLWSAV